MRGPDDRVRIFIVPLAVLLSIASYLAFEYVLGLHPAALASISIGITIGAVSISWATIGQLMKRQFAVDFIAILAVAVALITQEFLVAAIILLMWSGGNTLERYAMIQANRSLTALKDRIPNQVVLWEGGKMGGRVPIESVTVGSLIYIRKGEVIPLDGTLRSEAGQTDESSLTGEPYIIDKIKDDLMRSGTVNVGNPIVILVTKADTDSTYRKIVEMVRNAQEERPPIVRIANRYSSYFTVITLVIALTAYLVSHSMEDVLAVLVIATPCPLIIATPVALIGGMNASAKKRIIVKRLSSIEVLSRVNTLIFDKTGTITIGKPVVTELRVLGKFDQKEVYGIAEAIERNSLHPLAKAVVLAAKNAGAPVYHATEIEERIGSGISGTVNGERYTLSKPKRQAATSINLSIGKTAIAEFLFEDTVKPGTGRMLHDLKHSGMEIRIFTGDRKEAADRLMEKLDEGVAIKAECSPQDKKDGIAKLKEEGKTTAMVGDGINDAPALAAADVGMVFSHEEHTAASDAADIVFLGGDLEAVADSIRISKRTMGIAIQSITVGIGLSVLGMLLAAIGLIPPLGGAILQEAIDIAVILNALRASI